MSSDELDVSGEDVSKGSEVQLLLSDPEVGEHSPALSTSSNSEEHHQQGDEGEDSSEMELLLASEEEQEVDLRFQRPEASASVETGPTNPSIAVQQLAKSQLSTKAAADSEEPQPGVETFIARQHTTMLTTSVDNDPEEFEVISEESIKARNQLFWRNLGLGVGVIGVVLILGWTLKKAISTR
uniref:Uncharacterized protein n=1 Tax=Ditylenchus dipsaci TaxID=166011 RepID=A0A915E997_9BILA